jgi:hypothetical protein
MSGYVAATMPCYCCKQIFSYNPMRVPSINVNGMRQPICRPCVDLANPSRRASGLPEIAYDAWDESDQNE